MSVMMANDTWGREIENWRLRYHELLVLFKQRELCKNADPVYDQLTVTLQTGLNDLRLTLARLKHTLDAANPFSDYTSDELERRIRVWETNASHWKKLVGDFMRTSREDRQSALDPTNLSWLVNGNIAPQKENAPSGAATFRQRQDEMVEEQDRGLEALSEILSRQRDLASQLGNEVEDQNNILDSIANTMERVESGVIRETSNISQVNRRDSTWCYWLVILSLFIAIVVVALL